ncbi:hypothetical protein QYE76_052022 [Lolium multiflorum]|uniref:Glyceraldehyde 3-phosphate dehydrogenase NAD(P) binding domain-containing protein n=1 Tax=Lolium multiflorum TaxID=4521 RepID=A0AAD8WKP0_LOLMU|nr:hypothetical protein QYE76_052022 [Lolium multiflorum]
MGSVAPESTDSSSSMGSVAQPDASVAVPETTQFKTPIRASVVTPLVSTRIGSTAAALDSGTRALPFAGSSSAAAATAASPALDSAATSAGSGTAIDLTALTPNAALLPFIPPGSAFGDALYPYVVEQADTVFPSVLSCRAAPSLQAELPGEETPIDTSTVYVKGDPFGKTVYQDSETGPRKPDQDKKDVEPVETALDEVTKHVVETALDEVTKHVVETGLGEEHRGLEYLEKYLTTGEVEMLHLRSKAPTPQFIEVKKPKRGGRKFGPQPGEATIPRIGINGFGRIGNLVARLILNRNDMQMQLVAVNDPFVSAAHMTIYLKDMPPGIFPGIKVLDIAEPEQIPWAKVGGDYVVESTGIYTDMGTASAHLKGGAKKVVICALSIDARTFVYGVNENTYTPDIDIISIADSATICIALLAKTLNTAFGITDCHVTITGSSSGAIGIGMALSSIFPDLVGKFHVIVHPDPHVKLSCVEMTVKLDRCVDYEMIKNSVRSNVDPNNVPLASLVAQEENVDVNFIKNNNFNNNAYRNNSGNNYRPYPSANGNGYGNSYGNSYNNNRNVPSGLEAMLKEFISTQTAFNKSVEEKLDKIDTIASRVDRLASDVNLLKLKVMPNNDLDNKITTTANAIQVRINENIRLMAELRARWDREENEKLAKENNVAKVWTITTTSNANSSHVAAPPTINGKIIGVGNVSTPSAKRTKLPEIAKTAETACDKTAEIFSNLGNNDPIAVAHNDLDFDDCHISEVIKFLQKLAKSPNASAINLAFTKHITNALIKAREEKLKLETSIPRKLEDGWEPIIKMKFNDFECNALCDLGASISVMPKKIYDMLDLPPLKNCYLDVNLADNVKKKPLGRIDNVHITVNNNLVPVDFVVLDIECNASCPIVLGRPFLRTVGAVIDMREGNIKYQFPLKKGMEHFPRKRMKLPFDSIIRTSYDVDASTLDVT